MGDPCPTCGASPPHRPRPKFDTLAEQQAAWLAERAHEQKVEKPNA